MKGRRPRPLDDGDSGEVRVSGHLSWAKLIKNKRSFLAFSIPTCVGLLIISMCKSSHLISFDIEVDDRYPSSSGPHRLVA